MMDDQETKRTSADLTSWGNVWVMAVELHRHGVPREPGTIGVIHGTETLREKLCNPCGGAGSAGCTVVKGDVLTELRTLCNKC